VTEVGEPDRPAAKAARSKNALLALLLLAIPVVFCATWLSSRSRAKPLSKSLYTTAVELSECLAATLGEATTLRETLELSPADSTPLAGCAPLAARAQRELRELQALSLPRDKQGLRELGELATSIPEARFTERADALVSAEVESVESSVAGLVKGACRLAIGEGSLAIGACPPAERAQAPRAELPTPRVVLDAPAEFIQQAALSLEPGPSDELRLGIATRERDSESLGVWVGTSQDGGHSFQLASGRVGRADGSPEPPRATRGALLVTQRDEKGGFKSAYAARIDPAAGRLGDTLEIPALPEGMSPLRAGNPLWLAEGPKRELHPVLAIGPEDPERVGGALVRLLPGGKLELLPTPPGTLIAATSEPRPRVALLDAGALALYDVPRTGEKWPSPERVPMPASTLRAVSAAPALCGVATEQLFPLALRRGSDALFVAIGDPRMFALRFDAASDAELGGFCGSCPPGLLARAEDRLTLLLPIGNRMTALPLGAPLLVTGTRVAKRSVAACQADTVLVAHLAQGRVWVQTTRAGQWQLGRPRVLAAPDSRGTPVDVRVAASGGRLVVLWRRDQRMQLRLETLASDDGGVTWK